MSGYEVLFLIMALAMLVWSLVANHLRGAIWVAAICIDVILSDLYVTTGLPFPDAFIAGLDFTLCIAIYVFAMSRWEQWLFLLFQFSMLVSILYLAAGVVAPKWIDTEVYLTVLEAVNYAAIILVGGVGAYVATRRVGAFVFNPWRRVLAFDGALRRAGTKDGG